MTTPPMARSLPRRKRMTPRLRYLTWKLRALCWLLRRLRAGLTAGGIACFVSPLNYATGVALFLTALERQGWIVVAPNAADSTFDIQTQDELSTP